MSEQTFDFEAADADAIIAAGELEDIDPSAIEAIGEWWTKWIETTGHKRLARALLGQYKEIKGG